MNTITVRMERLTLLAILVVGSSFSCYAATENTNEMATPNYSGAVEAVNYSGAGEVANSVLAEAANYTDVAQADSDPSTEAGAEYHSLRAAVPGASVAASVPGKVDQSQTASIIRENSRTEATKGAWAISNQPGSDPAG